ncbi:MAG: hypothetical protein HYY30_03645 [Chloroflexi bacterium]|nr:hypothetical protein [Chloroflexota bacterium]
MPPAFKPPISIKHLARISCAVALAAAIPIAGLPPDARGEPESPYRVVEFPLRVAPAIQNEVTVSGRWAFWQVANDRHRIEGKNLEAASEFSFTTGASLEGPYDVDRDTVVTVESAPDSGVGIFGYRLPRLPRFTVAPFKSAEGSFRRRAVRISGRERPPEQILLHAERGRCYDAQQRLVAWR